MTLLLTTLVSCKKSFLEILPKGRVIATKTSDYDLLLNNLDLINYGNANSHVLMGDEVAAFEPRWNSATYREKQAFQFLGNLYNIEEDAGETLIPTKGLYIYNKVIDEVMSSTEGSEATKKSLQAEALAGRAWTNFLLVNFYGKPYNAATAATDLGFPLIMKADVNATDFRRATVQAMYDQIITDLTLAIPNLTHDGIYHRIRMSKAAAQGILAKAYVFMGRYADALPLLNESIDNLPKSLLATSLLDYSTASASLPTIVNDQENLYAKNMSNTYIGNDRLLWLTPEAASLFNADDLRLSRLFQAETIGGKTWYKRKGTTTYNFGLRVPELYLLRAEVKTRLDDLSGAAADLLLLRQNRMPATSAVLPASATASKISLLQFIMDERIREFTVTGYRWFDMRRLSVDPLFTTPTYQHQLYDATGTLKETYTLSPERFVLKFAPKVLGENPNLIDNP